MVSDTAARRVQAAKTTPLQRRKRVLDEAAPPEPVTTVPLTKKSSTTTESEAIERPKTRRGAAAVGRRLLAPRTLIAALLLTLIAATGFFGYHYFADGSDDAVSASSRTEAVDTASKYAVQLSSFDYRDLDKNRESITAMSTPDFAKKYSEMVTALSQIVTDGKGQASATATHVAIEKIDAHTATVLLFVDQKATNVVAPNGKSQPYRMVVTMKRSADHWLVDNVETK